MVKRPYRGPTAKRFLAFLSLASDVARASGVGFTLTYQSLLFCRVPINSILGFIIRTYKKVGLPIGPIVVPFGGSYSEFYKVILKRNYFGAYG